MPVSAAVIVTQAVCPVVHSPGCSVWRSTVNPWFQKTPVNFVGYENGYEWVVVVHGRLNPAVGLRCGVVWSGCWAAYVRWHAVVVRCCHYRVTLVVWKQLR